MPPAFTRLAKLVCLVSCSSTWWDQSVLQQPSQGRVWGAHGSFPAWVHRLGSCEPCWTSIRKAPLVLPPRSAWLRAGHCTQLPFTSYSNLLCGAKWWLLFPSPELAAFLWQQGQSAISVQLHWVKWKQDVAPGFYSPGWRVLEVEGLG